jgi:hypothetical protein
MCNCNTLILVVISKPFTIYVTNLTIFSFVPWFRISSQYGVGIALLIGFGKAMQYPPPPPPQVSKWMQISQNDVSISFKLHNFVQVDFLTLMWRILQFLHFFKSICMASYNEHGISIKKNILLFHGLWYYCKMMQVLLMF